MKIGTLGFPEDQLKKLDKILTLSKSRSMALADFDPASLPDLLLVMGDSLDAHAQIAELPDSFRTRLVLVNKQKPVSAEHPHIKLPFISSRVLRTLEAFEPLQPVDVARAVAVNTEECATVIEEPVITAASNIQAADELLAEPAAVPVTMAAVEHGSDAPIQADSAPIVPLNDNANTTQAQPMAAATTADSIEAVDKDNLFSKYDAQIEEVRRLQAEREAQQQDQHYAILVVDDSHPMQQMLAKELEQMDQPVNIDFADDGETALEKAGQNHYDFIFLDIMMPGIDGFETCTRLRQMPALKKTPIIMLSSKTSPLDEVKGIMAGSSTYLTKPINPVEFQKVIKRVSRWVSEFKNK